MVRSIYRFKTDALSVSDDFVPVLEEYALSEKRQSIAALQNASA